MAARKKSRKNNAKTTSKSKNRSKKKAASKKSKLLPQGVILARYNALDKLIRRPDWNKRPKGGFKK